MRVLVACEESQEVCKAFRARGHEAYSCDIQECSGGHPEWHICGDALREAYSKTYDLMIAHPPCTFLSQAGARWLYAKGELNIDRFKKGLDGFSFFHALLNAPIPRIAVENPIPTPIYRLPPHSQTIQPFYFGDQFQKTTLLWLRGLPPLKHFSKDDLFDKKTHVPRGEQTLMKSGRSMPTWYAEAWKLPKSERSKARSKTFPGIAKAMAEQWSEDLTLNT